MKLIDEHFDIQADLVQNPSATYFMRVGSDAMVGAGIHVGDKLVVDKAKMPVHKDIVVATIDGQFLVRRLYQANGLVELRAENENCSPTPLINSEDIWGVVVGVVRKY